MAGQPGVLRAVAGSVQLHDCAFRESGCRRTAACSAHRAGGGAVDAGLLIEQRAGVVCAVLGGSGEGASTGHGDGSVLILFPGSAVTLNAGVLSVVVPGQQEAAVLIQGQVAAQPGVLLTVAGSVQLHDCAFGESGCRCTAARSAHGAGGGAIDAGLLIEQRAGVVRAVLCGSGEGASTGHGDGSVLPLFPGSAVALDAGVFRIVIPGQQEAAVLVQGQMAAQPGVFRAVAGSVHLENHALSRLCRGGIRCGVGRLLGSLFGDSCAVVGLVRRRGRSRSSKEQHIAEDCANHRDDGHNARLHRQFQCLFPQQHQHHGGHHNDVHNCQQDHPVGAGVCGHSHSNAVGLGVQDVVAGPAHGLLCSVGRAVQGDAHQAEHHIAAGTNGQIHVHPAGVAHGGVSDDCAAEAPLVPQDAGQQGMACACPGIAQVAVTGHDAGGSAFLDRQLKGFQVKFTDGLFVGPYRQRQAVGLLVVEGKVFDVSKDALAHAAADFRCCQFAGEQAVLGVILKVTAAEGSAMDIGARRIQAGHMVSGSLSAQRLAEPLHQFHIPGSADDGLCREAHTFQVAGQAVDAGRAIQLSGGGLAHAVHRRGGPAAIGDHVGHVIY